MRVPICSYSLYTFGRNVFNVFNTINVYIGFIVINLLMIFFFLIFYGTISLGGLYFIISRAIGPEFGASIGILLAFANTISAAMNTIGFATSLKSLLNSKGITIIDDNFVFRIFGIMCIIIQSVLCCIGMDREAEVRIQTYFINIRDFF